MFFGNRELSVCQCSLSNKEKQRCPRDESALLHGGDDAVQSTPEESSTEDRTGTEEDVLGENVQLAAEWCERRMEEIIGTEKR